ncbi:STAS domain-containing protein [Streptomyces sp. NPDC002580]|uniref:STAS domain-containing protein n=1 Tax=Streptomyces sp. NPDC002580 TaxID=3364653 RepID=UPI0036CBB2A6
MTRLAGFDLDHLRLTAAEADDAVHVRLDGFLDYDSADYFLAAATRPLAATPGLRHLHLECGALSGIDSMGLAMLLMLHRRTTAVGVSLHLDNRTPALDRLLDITGTLDLLVPDRTGQEKPRNEADAAGPLSDLLDGRRMAYRHTSKGGSPAGFGGAGPDASSDIRTRARPA